MGLYGDSPHSWLTEYGDKIMYRNRRDVKFTDFFANLTDWQAMGGGAILVLFAVWFPFLTIAPMPAGYLIKWYGVPFTLMSFGLAVVMFIAGINMVHAGWLTFKDNLIERENQNE